MDKDENVFVYDGERVTFSQLTRAWHLLQQIADELPAMPDAYYELMGWDDEEEE